MSESRNVLGGRLEACCLDPLTGFYRDGCCRTGPEDTGVHAVCIQATEAFLEFSSLAGNDLTTPVLQWGFPGLKPGDRWCLCAARWQEALLAGAAPPVVLAATDERALDFVSYIDLVEHAIDPVGRMQDRG